MKLRYLATLAVLAVVFAACAARAGDIREQQSVVAWRKLDQCSRAAFAKFPDYTPESNAAREQAMRACEIKNHLPVRAPVSDSPVKTIPDDAAN